MAHNQVQREMTAQEAYNKMQAESAKNTCVVTGKPGAQYAVYVKDGVLGADGKPRFSHTSRFVIRTKKKGMIIPDAKSEDPAERLAAQLTTEGLEFEIRPTYWLSEFFRINNMEQDEKNRRSAEGQAISSAFASFKKPTTVAAPVANGHDGDSAAEPMSGNGATSKVDAAPETKPAIPPETPPTTEQKKFSPFSMLSSIRDALTE